jgi:hypothetical protein
MTKARDLANIIAGGFTVDDLPTLTETQIPNLSASKITSGTFADARLSASSVTQHSTPFDDNKLVNDISTLALRQASDENKSAYNTNSSSVDVFQDATGIDTTTNAFRNASEYVNTISQVSKTPYVFNMEGSSITNDGTGDTTGITVNQAIDAGGRSTTRAKFGSQSIHVNNNSARTFHISASPLIGSSDDFTFEMFFHNAGFNDNTYSSIFQLSTSSEVENTYIYKVRSGISGLFQAKMDGDSGSASINSYIGTTDDQWRHVVVGRKNGALCLYIDGSFVREVQSNTTAFTAIKMGVGAQITSYGWFDSMRFSPNTALYNFGSSSITVPTSALTDYVVDNSSATGNFTSTNITAPSSVSSMGAIITYQDQSGTNALNTDIVLQLSADGGSNYSTATLTALPDFSTGIKMAKVNDLSVTAGTSLKYKISFANQAQGTKEARIRGVALQY